MSNYVTDHITISGPPEDIDRIIQSYSTKQDYLRGDRRILLLDGEKILPYPPGIEDTPEKDLDSPRPKWRRDNWGCAAPSYGIGFERLSQECVKGGISTRWASPER